MVPLIKSYKTLVRRDLMARIKIKFLHLGVLIK